jgi:hypothetical protein
VRVSSLGGIGAVDPSVAAIPSLSESRFEGVALVSPGDATDQFDPMLCPGAFVEYGTVDGTVIEVER